MEAEKRRRRGLRGQVTKIVNEGEAELAKDAPDRIQLDGLLGRLENLTEKIAELNEKIMDLMMQVVDGTDEEVEAELDSVGEYEMKAARIRKKIDTFLYPPRPRSPTPSESKFATPPGSVAGSSVSATTSGANQKRRFKLPELKFKKFDGNLKEWLGFWGQFKKIHEDDSMDDATKFQYLVQAMVADTEASRIVNGYPQSADNYPKAVQALQQRFGKEALLIQVYVRELLSLSFHHVLGKEKIPLSTMVIELKSHLRSLESLNLSKADPSTWLYPLVESSLSVDILKAWERSSFSKLDGSKENPPKSRLDYLVEFLDTEVESDQRIELARQGFQELGGQNKNDSDHKSRAKHAREKSEVPTASGLYSGQSNLCIFCDKHHASADCRGAQRMTLQQRKEKVSAKRGCYVCLKPGHPAKACTSGLTCKTCGGKHLQVLCPESKPNGAKPEAKSDPPPSTQNNLCSTGEVMLPTLLAALVHNGQRKIVRVLFDTGSQHSYIKVDTAKELGLKPTGNVQYRHCIFGKKTYVEDHDKFEIQLEKLGRGKKTEVKLEVLTQNQICEVVPRMPKGSWMTELKKKEIWLSDTGSGQGAEIEILVGAKEFAQFITGNSHWLKNGLVAMETRLGWILLGSETDEPKFSDPDKEADVKTLISMHVSSAEVSKLWDLDTIGIMDPVEHKSKMENLEETKLHFLESVTRTQDGRYSVRLPWIDGAPDLPDNRGVAMKRLTSATSKLRENGQFEAYGDMFQDWLAEGIIEKVAVGTTDGHFIPHHPVFKPGSATTPVRPVFDASCKIKGSPSLNDCLRRGPNLMELIPSVLLRFRENKIGVLSDIRKAFLMVGVQEEDRNFLKFLWWEGPSQNQVIELRHRRVVFGVNSSPFLLAAVLEYHLTHVNDEDKTTASKLWKSMYVDNCVTSVSSREEYVEFRETATRLLEDAKMELRCWEHGALHLTCEESPERSSENSQARTTSVLGLTWDKHHDTLSIDLELPEVPEKVTKRNILSAVHKVYDPIGFVSPVLLQPKLILQEVWAQDVTWDEEVNSEVVKRFRHWVNELAMLKKVSIPRHVNPYTVDNRNLSIHTFCDASKDAFAAVIFVRAETSEGISVRLLQAKNRVAPLNRVKDKDGIKKDKRLSIPRLELLAATIGARLTNSTKEALGWNDVTTHFWSDSTTAIAWIQRNEDWGTFVGNRVREILTLTKGEDWGHVPGKHNPADLPSRGCTAAQFLGSRWWEGPDWLYRPSTEWPVSVNGTVDEAEVAAERKKSVHVLTSSSTQPVFVPQFSDYQKNVSVMARVLRFIGNVRKPKSERIHSRFLTSNELRAAQTKLLKIIQGQAFPNGVKDLTPLNATEEDGLLKVSTKLTFREDTAEFRKPVVLPKDHPLVTQLIRYVHEKSCHGGAQVVLSELREKYWITQARRAVNKVIRSCTTCRRYAVKNLTVDPAPLPIHRVEAVEAFQNSGVDLAGPLFLADGNKCWIVLFTCAVYRAVHLDLVTSLSTEAFIGSLERFIHTSGRPDVLHSDNGTNFVGAENLFKKIDWKQLEEACGVKQINWIFNPPTAAWWGGWWERLIRSVKDLLRKTLGRARLTYDELRTCLSAVEATVNSRPLTTVTEDSGDLVPLTPMMFTRTLLLPKFPEAAKITSQELQKRFKRIQDLKKELQARFRKEYLALLVQKASERKSKPPEVGDVVLVGSDDKKRYDWPLGRIMELLPGKDSYVRTAKVLVMVKKSGSKRKSSGGENKMTYKTQVLVRPLQRLYPLEVRKAEEEPQLTVPKAPEEAEVIPPTIVEEVVIPSDDEEPVEQVVATRCGRKVVRPRRYGEWKWTR